MIAVVLRGFDGDGKRREAGEVVDVATWPMADKLIDHRYIRPATPEEVLSFKGIEGASSGSSSTPPSPASAPKRGK